MLKNTQYFANLINRPAG